MRARIASGIFLLLALSLTGSVAKAGTAPSHTSIYQLDSKWQMQSGQTVSLDVLKGKPVVAAMIYTSYQDSCPFMVEKIKQVERRMGRQMSDVRYALFSFDSKRDIPAKLRSYAKVHGLNLKRWTLFHGDDEAVHDLATNLGIQYKPLRHGEFAHSNTIIVLNNDGQIAFTQPMSIAGTKRIVAHLKALLRAK